jgi:hypothetical protein
MNGGADRRTAGQAEDFRLKAVIAFRAELSACPSVRLSASEEDECPS